MRARRVGSLGLRLGWFRGFWVNGRSFVFEGMFVGDLEGKFACIGRIDFRAEPCFIRANKLVAGHIVKL